MKENKEIAERGGTMAKGNLVSRMLEHGKKAAKGLRNKALFLAAAGVIAVGGYATRAQAKEYEVYPADDVATINNVIAASEPNDTINFTNGTYSIWFGENYNLKPNRNYFFDKVIIDGKIPKPSKIFRIAEGGNIDISGTLTIQNTNDGFWIGNVPYDNINIRGVNFNNVEEYGVVMDNIKDPHHLEWPAITLRDCMADGGKKLVKVAGTANTEETPYPSVVNSTLKNITSDSGSIYLPKYWDYNLEKFIVKGHKDQLNLIIINCHSISDSENWGLFSSFKNIAHLYTELDPNNPNEAIPYLDGTNCFIADPNDFLSDGITPRRDSRMNLENGRYIGAIEPHHDLLGNLNFDEVVDFRDFNIAANRYNGNLEEIANVSYDWLVEEPNDPNGDPKN